MVFARAIFLGQEGPSVKRLKAQNGKEIGAYRACSDSFGLSYPGNVIPCAGIECHLLKDMVLLLPIEEVRCRDREARHSREALLRRNVPNLHQPISVTERQWFQQNSMHDAEDSGVRANTERHDQDCYQCKAWALAQQPECKFQIPHQFWHFPASVQKQTCYSTP